MNMIGQGKCNFVWNLDSADQKEIL